MPAPTSCTSRYPGELVLSVRRSPLALFQRMAAAGGDVVRARVGHRTVYLINQAELARQVLTHDPDDLIKERALRLTKPLLGEGLLTSEGALHRRQRKLVLPYFSHSRVASYAAAMVAAAERAQATWDDGDVIDVDREMMSIALDAIGRTLFAVDLVPERERLGAALSEWMSVFQEHVNPFAALLPRLPTRRGLRLRRAHKSLDELAHRIIEDFRSTPREGLPADLLTAGCPRADGRCQARDDIITLLLAGHETTALTMAWAWYRIAEHPEVEAQLHREIDRIAPQQALSYEHLNALPYTQQIVSETLRLYPPIWGISREATRPLEFGGYAFPRASTLSICFYTLHRDARYWCAPDAFRPERFGPEASAARPRGAYLPFSMGIRGCIGERFARTELALVLASLARRWRFLRVDSEPVGERAGVTLRPARPIRMRLELRAPPHR